MDFSYALVAVKAGAKIFRDGWNGENQYVVRQKGYPDGIPINKNTAEATGGVEGAICVFRPYLMFCAADGEFVPWVATQSDLLADDWRWEQVNGEVPSWRTPADLERLELRAREMYELEVQGVDNWDGYGAAMRRAHGEDD